MKGTLLTAIIALLSLSVMAQETEVKNVDANTGATEQVSKKDKLTNALSRLHIGGYGEAVMTRNFYSQSFNRYKKPELYANDKSHGRFDLPHICLNIGYDFGKGWTMGSEIEYEHGGTGSAVEIEAEEAGEYEAEVEKGGEVNIEQFWINKAFMGGKLNVKAGEIIVPVGYSNAYHEPNQFFTVYRPEGEATIMPNTWHQVGLSVWGRLKDWRYEAQLLSGLNSESFTAEDFAHYGATSPYEFKVANNYAGAVRIDNYSIKGLRIGLSGYYGYCFRNTLRTPGTKYEDVKGALGIIALDFSLNRWNWIVRGNIDYAYFSDADIISAYNQANWTHHKYQDGNPHHYTNIGSNAVAYAIEAGYDIFSQIAKLKEQNERLYLFGRFEHYNTMASGSYESMYKYTKKYRWALGVNYSPIKQITIKGEYSYRFFEKPDNNGLAPDSPLYKQPYNNEPSISLGVTYTGWFL
ncbi:MAG: hypothetical protein IKO58_01200 [Prevotella sp.]|nr:hypothetical protein [Prevotella sp.]